RAVGTPLAGRPRRQLQLCDRIRECRLPTFGHRFDLVLVAAASAAIAATDEHPGTVASQRSLVRGTVAADAARIDVLHVGVQRLALQGPLLLPVPEVDQRPIAERRRM